MQKAVPFLLVALSVLGIWLGSDLTDKHFQLIHQPDLAFDSVCEINATISCAKVNASKWSSVSLGEGRAELPVSIPAVGFYVVVLLLSLMAAFEPKRRQKALAWMALGMGPALLFSFYLLALQAFAIHAWCLFCLALDATSIAVAVLAFVGHGGGFSGILEDAKSDKGLAGIAIIGMLVVSWISYSNYSGRVAREGKKPSFAASGEADDGPKERKAASKDEEMSPEEKAKAIEQARGAVSEFVAEWPSVEAHDITIDPYDAIKGKADSDVVFVEFADFDCPHCKMAGWFLKDISQRYGDRVNFVFKHYPLGTACNPSLSRDLHPDACQAAVATQCARRGGQFWEFHDYVFDNQGNLGTKTMLKIADTLGMDRASFEECLNRDTVWDEVRTQVQQGKALGITGTPTMFVNGKELSSPHPLIIEAALREELKARGVTDLPEDTDNIFP